MGALFQCAESQLLAALLSVWIVRGDPIRHVFLWLMAVSFVCWLTLAIAFVRRSEVLRAPAGSRTLAGTMLGVMACCAFLQIERAVDHPPGPQLRRQIRTATGTLECLRRESGVDTFLLRFVDPLAWDMGAGIALQSLENGRPPVLEEEERYRFGSAFRYTSRRQGQAHFPTVHLASPPVAGSPPIGMLEDSRVSVDVRIDFGHPSARSFLEDGWSGDERADGHSFVWATGRSARLRVGLFPQLSYRLRFAVGPPPTLARQHVDVVVNGKEISGIDLAPEWSTHELEIPSNVVQPSTIVDFRFDRAITPSSVGLGDDERPLAAALDWLVMEAVWPPACVATDPH